MRTTDTHRLQPLQEGQLWRVEHGYVYILELGKRLIRYKLLRHSRPGPAAIRMIRPEALLNYLRQSEAELVCSELADAAKPARALCGSIAGQAQFQAEVAISSELCSSASRSPCLSVA